MTFRELLEIIINMPDEDLNLEVTVFPEDGNPNVITSINPKMGFIDIEADPNPDDWDDDDCC